MTDNEIIKALQEWSERGMCFCSVSMNEFARNILALINRQKAVIEELGKRTNIKKVILPFINEKGEMVERTFNVDINCLEEGDHDDR